MQVPISEKQAAVASLTRSCSEELNSNGIPELEGLAGIEVPGPTEKDENVEKAEAYMKQLDDVSANFTCLFLIK